MGIEDFREVWEQLEMIGTQKIFRTILLFLLALQVATLPVPSSAGRKVASVRTGQNKKKQTQYPSDRELINAIRQASLEAIGRLFLLYDSPEDLKQLVLSSMSPKDREEMRPLLNKGVPKLSPRINGDALELTGPEGKFVIRWPQFPASTFNINGVDWTVSSHLSLKFNVEHLVRLQLRYGKKSTWIQLFAQEAKAINPGTVGAWLLAAGGTLVIAFLGAVLGEGVKTMKESWTDNTCLATYKNDEATRVSCISTLEKIAKAKELHGQLSAVKTVVDAKKTSISGSGLVDERTMWVPGAVQSCPSSKQQDVYISDVIMAKVQNGKSQKLGDWQTVKFELQTGTGKFKSGIIVSKGTDLNSADLLDSAKATFEFDENGLKSIHVPNPQRTSLETPPFVPINMARDEAALQPWELAEKTKWVDMVSQISILINACIIAQSQADVNASEAKSGAKPATPIKQDKHPALPAGAATKGGAPKEDTVPTVR
jgi:hypothetical protein